MKTVSFLCEGNEAEFTKDTVVQVINATADGMTIHESTNFIIRADQDAYCHNVFAPVDIPLELPWNITITYYYAPNPPTGYYLGSDAGLSWQDTMYTSGHHYPQNISKSDAILARNAYFFLNPIPGEVDWRWEWTGTERPRSGYYQIFLYDAVKLLEAYGSRGDGEYNPTYLPGADIDQTDLCHIGLYDAVLLLSNYGQKFGTPPDP